MDLHENARLTLRRREELVQHVHAQVSYAELSRELGLSQHLTACSPPSEDFFLGSAPTIEQMATFYISCGSHNSTRSWTLCAGRLVYGTTSSLGDGATAAEGR